MNDTQTLTATSADAVQGMSFCSVWPIARGLLNGVLPSVASVPLRTAFTALVAAADSVCPSSFSSSSSIERLAKFGLIAAADKVEFLAGLSDQELQVLSTVQRSAAQSGLIQPYDFGNSGF